MGSEFDPSKDFQLSPHFSFFELTVTGNESLQASNRAVALTYIPTLRSLASFLEIIRGGRALCVNSAFRSPALNVATKGSSPTSQHPLGQAADIHRPDEDVGKTFSDILALVKENKIPFGQLIDESADRGYGVVRWVHISLGRDFWKPERCGEVLKKWDENGAAHFKMLEKVAQEAV